MANLTTAALLHMEIAGLYRVHNFVSGLLLKLFEGFSNNLLPIFIVSTVTLSTDDFDH